MAHSEQSNQLPKNRPLRLIFLVIFLALIAAFPGSVVYGLLVEGLSGAPAKAEDAAWWCERTEVYLTSDLRARVATEGGHGIVDKDRRQAWQHRMEQALLLCPQKRKDLQALSNKAAKATAAVDAIQNW